MTRKDKELLLQDLCGRLPYGVKCEIGGKLEILDSICDDDGYYFNFIGEDKEGYTLDEVKPYLFPLSSMTKEQMEELKELCDMYTPDDDYCPYAYMGIEVLNKHVLDDDYEFNFKTDAIDWFNKNHFDYRGLIPKGSAIDATGLNIY